MFGSNVLEVAIGLCFVFLILSLISSAANELLEMILKKRAADLEKGIGELLGDPEKSKAFLTEIYNHGLVNSLYQGDYQTSKQKPSYIPSENFALALLSVRERWMNAPSVDGAAVAIPANVQSAFASFEKTAKGDFQKLRESVEQWYDSAMDRVSGWYKRRTQKIILVIGFVLAVAVNADCVGIAKLLTNDTTLRQSVVALAEAEAKTPPDSKGKPSDTIHDELQSLKTLGLPDKLGLPIGWSGKEDWSMSAGLQRVLGWLLTAVAVSLGAPFWFDLLNKIIVVRSTVKPNEKSGEESSKDPAKATGSA